MSNELLLVINLVIMYTAILFFYKFFGASGLICWTVFATIAANIEVMILITAFGYEQTLGNILFATTFIVTDILSEVYGKKKAQQAVNIGIMVSAMFIITSQLWLLYTPSADDRLFAQMQAVFSNTPRIMFAGILVYALVQKFDVWLYHKLWDRTTKHSGERHSFLWLRNNGSTLISQLLNTLLFTFAAFWGVYDLPILKDIIITSYTIFVVTSILDTPVVYIARSMKVRD